MSRPEQGPLYAQQGDEARCWRCGRKVEFRVVAHDAFTGAPFSRWVAVRKTRLAPIPIECPAHLRGQSVYHETEAHAHDGTPRLRDGSNGGETS